VLDLDLFAEMALELLQQRQRVVVVAKTHGLAGLQRRQGAEDRRVAEAFRDAARIEGVGVFGEHGDGVRGHGRVPWGAGWSKFHYRNCAARPPWEPYGRQGCPGLIPSRIACNWDP